MPDATDAPVHAVRLEDGGWAVVDPEGRYDASNDGDVAGLHGVIHNQPVALRELRDRCYEPGLLARCLGLPGAPPRMAPGSKVKSLPSPTPI